MSKSNNYTTVVKYDGKYYTVADLVGVATSATIDRKKAASFLVKEDDSSSDDTADDIVLHLNRGIYIGVICGKAALRKQMDNDFNKKEFNVMHVSRSDLQKALTDAPVVSAKNVMVSDPDD